MPLHIRRMLLIAGVAALVLVGPGCDSAGKGAAHKKAVNEANQRWLNMRTGMMLQMANQQFSTGDLDQAERTLNEALDIDKKNGQIYTLAGRVALERGQLERSYHLFNLAMEFKSRGGEAQYYQGLILQRWQQYDGALIRYQQAAALEPDNAAYLLAFAEMQVATDRVDDARQSIEDRLTYFDQNAGIRTALAQIYMLKHEPEKAMEYLRQASLLRPDDLQIVENLAMAQAQAGKHDDAVKTLERLLGRAEYANRRDLMQALVSNYVALDRLDSAKTVLIKLTKTDPNDVDSWIRLGQLVWKMEDLSGTLLAANRVINLAPRRHEGHLLAGMVWQKRGDVDKALTHFDQAAAVAPENTLPLIMRGLALEKAGRTAAAADAYNQALKRKPDDERAQRLLTRLSAVDVPN